MSKELKEIQTEIDKTKAALAKLVQQKKAILAGIKKEQAAPLKKRLGAARRSLTVARKQGRVFGNIMLKMQYPEVYAKKYRVYYDFDEPEIMLQSEYYKIKKAIEYEEREVKRSEQSLKRQKAEEAYNEGIKAEMRGERPYGSTPPARWW